MTEPQKNDPNNLQERTTQGPAPLQYFTVCVDSTLPASKVKALIEGKMSQMKLSKGEQVLYVEIRD